MKDIAKKVPIPIAGVSLSFASFGKLILPFTNSICYWICGIISMCLLSLLVLKFIFDFESIRKDYCENIILIPLFTLIPMAITVLNSYFIEFNEVITSVIYYFALTLFFINSLYCVYKFIKLKHFHKLYPSMFVNLIGIDVVVFNHPIGVNNELLSIILYATLFFYILLIIAITLLMLQNKNLDRGTKPLLAIYAAPPSLIFVTYSLHIPTHQSQLLLFSLFFMSVVGIIVLLYVFCKTALSGFIPSLAAFTFPVVINTLATKILFSKFNNPILGTYYYIEFIICTVVIFYVLFEYIKEIFFNKITVMK